MFGTALLLCIGLFTQRCQGEEYIDYRLQYNYGTRVHDWSDKQNYGENSGFGTSQAIYTPYGLYLNQQVVKLPPNAIRSQNFVVNENRIGFLMYFRYLQGTSGNLERELLTLYNSSNKGLQLRQKQASATSNPKFEVAFVINNNNSVKEVSTTYSLSKL